MTHNAVLASIRIAGYHNDLRSYIRLYTENRIPKRVADQAWQNGVSAKASGVACSCRSCSFDGANPGVFPQRRRRGGAQ